MRIRLLRRSKKMLSLCIGCTIGTVYSERRVQGKAESPWLVAMSRVGQPPSHLIPPLSKKAAWRRRRWWKEGRGREGGYPTGSSKVREGGEGVRGIYRCGRGTSVAMVPAPLPSTQAHSMHRVPGWRRRGGGGSPADGGGVQSSAVRYTTWGKKKCHHIVYPVPMRGGGEQDRVS